MRWTVTVLSCVIFFTLSLCSSLTSHMINNISDSCSNNSLIFFDFFFLGGGIFRYLFYLYLISFSISWLMFCSLIRWRPFDLCNYLTTIWISWHLQRLWWGSTVCGGSCSLRWEATVINRLGPLWPPPWTATVLSELSSLDSSFPSLDFEVTSNFSVLFYLFYFIWPFG